MEADASALLVPQRFDLAIKVLYAHDFVFRERSDFARQIYLEHIRAFNGFLEMDHTRKRGASQFERTFNELIQSVVANGFREDYLVPVSSDGVLLDGAHRVSVCLALGLPVKFIVIENTKESPNYDSNYFESRGLHRKYLDAGTMEYLRRATDARLALVWPSAVGNEVAVQELLSQHTAIVSRKDLHVDGDFLVNLVKLAYRGEAWLGDRSDDFAGARAKASYCSQQPGSLRTFLLAGDQNLDACKSQIRALFDIGRHSIHVTDGHAETQQIASLIFNENSSRAAELCPATPPKWFERMFAVYDKWVDGLPETIDRELLCVDGSSVLAAHGARDIRDFDFLYAGQETLVTGFRDIAQHDGVERYLPVSLAEVVADPSRHFYYAGRKFLTLQTLRDLKIARGEAKDRADVQLIDSIRRNESVSHQRGLDMIRLFSARKVKGRLKVAVLRSNFAVRAWVHGRRAGTRSVEVRRRSVLDAMRATGKHVMRGGGRRYLIAKFAFVWLRESLDRACFVLRHPRVPYVHYSRRQLRQLRAAGYYSQYGQDYYFWNTVWGRRGPGYFVDIGGNDPVELSNTLFLEGVGWQGCAFDPLRRFESRWRSLRGATFHNLAVAKTEMTRPFVEILTMDGWEHTLSGFKEFVRQEDMDRFGYLEYDVRAGPIVDLLEPGVEVNLVLIDVEGAEQEVISGVCLPVTKPEYLLVENVSVVGGNQQLRTQLSAAGYDLIARIGSADDLFHRR